MAIEVLEKYAERCDEQWEARDVFYADLDVEVPAMAGHFEEASEAAFLFWFAFDYQLDDGSYVVDRCSSCSATGLCTTLPIQMPS
jgi:hypothetical protein